LPTVIYGRFTAAMQSLSIIPRLSFPKRKRELGRGLSRGLPLCHHHVISIGNAPFWGNSMLYYYAVSRRPRAHVETVGEYTVTKAAERIRRVWRH